MNTGEIYFHKQCSVVMSCSHTDRPHFRLRQIPVQQTVYIISLEQGNIIIYCLLSYCFLVPICDHLNIILLILTGNGVVDNKLFMRDTHSIRFTSIKAMLLLADVIVCKKNRFLANTCPAIYHYAYELVENISATQWDVALQLANALLTGK